MNYNNTVIIMRGVPGSGKDTWIKNNVNNARICSADLFFTNEDGEYLYDIRKMSEAHSWCMSEFLKALYEHVPTIVVNNTNINTWEWENYARAAVVVGYDVEVVSIVCSTIAQLQECCSRNIHNVPAEVIATKAISFKDTVVSAPGDLHGRIKSTIVQMQV